MADKRRREASLSAKGDASLPLSKRHLKTVAAVGVGAASSAGSGAVQPGAAPAAQYPEFGPEDMDIEIVKFQHKQISRRLRQRNKENELLAKRLQKTEEQLQQRASASAVLLQSWDQLHENLKILTSDLPGVSHKCTDDDASLFKLLAKGTTAEVEPEIKRRCEDTSHILTAVCKALSASNEGSSDLSKRASYAEESAIKASNKVSDLKRKLQVATEQNAALTDQLHECNFQLEKARNQIYRLRDQVTAAERKTAKAVADATSLAASAKSDGANDNGGATVPQGQLVQLEEELASLKATADGREEEIKQLREDKETLELRVAELSQRDISEKELQAHSEFKNLQYNLAQSAKQIEVLQAELQERNDDLLQINSARRTEFANLGQLDHEHQVKLDETLKDMADELKKTCRERDQLRLTLDQQSLLLGSKQDTLLKEQKLMVDAANVQIAQLKAEVSRVRKTKGAAPAVDAGVGKESEEIARLKKELKDAQESEAEIRLLLKVYKSASKDSREKRDLLVVEQKLKEEVAELKERISKGNFTDGAGETADKVAALEKELEAYKMTEEELVEEMEMTGQAFEDAQAQSARLMSQLQEKEEAKLELMSEKLKSREKFNALHEEKKLLEDKVTLLHQDSLKKAGYIQQLGKNEKTLHESLQQCHRQLHGKEQQIAHERRMAQEKDMEAHSKHTKLKEMEEELMRSREACKDAISKANKGDGLIARLQEKTSELRRELNKYQGVDAMATADEILLAEIDDLRKQLKCKACNQRPKNTVITKCFHTFCEECIKARIANRDRRCPECNKSFDKPDYRRIYL